MLISFAAAGAKCTCSASSTCNARFNLLFLKSLHLKHENNSTRINKVGFFLMSGIVINNMCRMYQRLQIKCSAGKRQFVTRRRQNSRASEEPTFVGCSLASVWDSHCTSSTEVRWDEDRAHARRLKCQRYSQWSSTVSSHWEHTDQACGSWCLAGS